MKIKGVPETLLIPVWARATETNRVNPIIVDEKAVELLEKIDYDFAKFDNQEPTLLSIAIRTEILDKATTSFINQNDDAVIINIGCGLDNRFFRVDNGKIFWYDLDLPEVIQIRREFFEETDRYKMIEKSVFDYSWINEIRKDHSVLIIAEGILMYFTENEVKNLLNQLINSFKGAEMLMETIPEYLVKQNQKKDLIRNQYQINAQFHWGINRGRKIERLNHKISFIEDWHYFDYHKSRWNIIRWLSLIPTFKNRFGNRIVHVRFLNI